MPDEKIKKGFGIKPAVRTLENVGRVYPALETAANFATMSYGLPASGVAGLAGLGIGVAGKALGITKKPAIETASSLVKKVQQALIYEPQTKRGTELTQAAGYPFAKLGEAGETVQNKLEEVGHPYAGIVARTLIEGSPAFLGLKELGKARLPIEESAVERGLTAAQIESNRALSKLRSQEGAVSLERRQNTNFRKRVAEMNPEERAQALLTDPLTGQKNKRAYEETERLPYQASLDVDGLKYVNDTYGHEAGNVLLQRVGEALENAAGEGKSYHFHGDEFALEGLSKAELGEVSRKAKEYLKENPIELTDAEGKKIQYTPDFSIGIAETLDAADKAMLMNKKLRRVERGVGPTKETPVSRALEKDELNNAINSEMSAEELGEGVSFIAVKPEERTALTIREQPEKATLVTEQTVPVEEKGLTPSEERPSLVSSRRVNDMAYLSFDAAGKIPTKEELKQLFPGTTITQFESDIVSTTNGVVKFRIDANGPDSYKRMEEAYNNAIGTDKPLRVSSKLQDALPADERLSRALGQTPVENVTPNILSVKDNATEFTPVLNERGTLDAKQTKEQLPPVSPGNVRLYRVEKAPASTENIPEALKKAPEAYQPERYFTSDLDYAGYYQEAYGPNSTLRYVDIPKSIADKYLVPGKKTNAEYLLPESIDTNAIKPKATIQKEVIQTPKESIEPITFTDEPVNRPRAYTDQPPPPSGPKPPKLPGGQPPLSSKSEGGVLPASDNAFTLGIERFIQYFPNNRFSLEKIQGRLKQMNEGIDLLLKEVNRPKQVARKIKKQWEDNVTPLLQDVVDSGKGFNEFEDYAYAVHAPEVNRVLRLDNAKLNLVRVFKAIGKEKKKEFLKKFVKKGDKPTPENMYNLLNLAFEEFKNYKKVQTVKANWDKFAEKPSGLTDVEAAELVRKYSGNEKLESARQKLRTMTDETLDLYHDSGVIPDAEFNAMKTKYKEYVPLHREGFEADFKSTGQGIQPAGKPFKTRAGSTKRVVNIVANAVANYETAIQRVAKAESDTVFAKMVNANPDPNFWSIIKVKQSPRRDVYGNISYYPNTNDVAKNEMRIMIKGKQYLVSVNKNEPTLLRMLDVLKGTSNSQVGTFIRGFAKINKFLARMNTSWSPEFMFGNFPKDLETALINIHSTGVKLPSVKSVLKGSLKSVGAIYQVERGAEPKTRLQLTYDRFRNAGGKIDWSDSYKDIPNLAKNISIEFDLLKGKRIPRKLLTSMVKLIENANTAVENGIRLHVFDLATRQGFSDAQAARVASQITVDFTQHGNAGPVINSLWLFANASLGGTYRMIQNMVKSKTVRYKIVPSIIGAGFVNGLYNSWIGGKDKDGKDHFNKMDDFIKERNMVFMIPGTEGKHVQLPLAYGYGFFWNLGNEFARSVTEVDYSALKGSARMVNSFSNSFNPIGSGTLGQTISPTFFDPFVQIYENKTWFGGDLVPPENPFEKVKTPDSERSWKNTSPTIKWIAQELNSLTKGNKVRSGLIDISPETINLWFDTVGGSALTFAKRVFKIPEKLINKENVAVREIPIVRRFTGAKSEWADSRTYYDNSRQVFTVQDEFEVYKNDPEYYALDKKYGFMRELFAPAKLAEYQLKQARKLKRDYEAKNLKPLVDQQDKVIQDIYVQFNKRFYEVIKRENKRR